MVIHKVVCVGAGLIGQGWATIFSSAGLEVTLQDVTETLLEKAMEGVKSNLIFLEAKSFLKQGEAEAALKRIKTSRLIGEAVREADYVQESVPDHYDFKKQVFREMDVAA